MATYAELMTIATTSAGDVLKNQIKVGVIIAAKNILLESSATTNHTARLAWAKVAVTNPDVEAQKMLWAVLAQNNTATPAQITSATDATVQTAIDSAVNLLAQ